MPIYAFGIHILLAQTGFHPCKRVFGVKFLKCCSFILMLDETLVK